ncbi:PC-esterase domain-containing protein 1A [Gadus morhua]|uniref:PC-esterase domain-containing protein 1A-like n=1 Tax=Gadus morhua TaxID=8049 RepID=A0A8C5BRH7_GADMO|nr:PC-esterase domain-containing protein 1A-like [Gadus morhua]XP_056442850.1 PC-esterase domain-containing protein 1A-like isoform X2 [Gadus chalcogrammus]
MSYEAMASVGHQTAAQLLHNRSVVVIGDSIQRSAYKDLVLLLQRDGYLSDSQLRRKGELTFESDSLVEGGCLDQMHNGTNYREVREFRSTHHRVRFYFVTRVFSRYMSSVLEDLRADAPDVVLVNSCIWDISRYKAAWEEDYAEDLHLFLGQLKEAVPRETLVVWNLTMPLGRRVLGGFLTPEVASRAGTLRYDVVEANFIGGALADAYGADVLDMHFHFRLSLQQRTKDGVHWNALAHRRMTCLILGHAAEAWGVQLPPALPRTRTAFAIAGSMRCGLAPPRPATLRGPPSPPAPRKAPATTPAPKFQPYPSEQNQPPGARSPYIMKKQRTRWRQRAPYSYSQRPFLDAPYRQGPRKAPQYNQWSQHIEAAYNQRLREDAPYSQPLQHIFFPFP